jgi:hypothetical protein
MLLLVAVALLLLGAGAFACALRAPLTSTLLTAYLFASAEVVLIAEALSPFRIGRVGFPAAEALAAAAGVAVWQRAGRPLPAVPHLTRGLFGRHTMLVVLAAAVGAGLCFEVFLAVSAAPNTWDGLTASCGSGSSATMLSASCASSAVNVPIPAPTSSKRGPRYGRARSSSHAL